MDKIMKMRDQRKHGLYNDKFIYFCMILFAVGLSIKYIFIDLGIDAEYQIVMAYRVVTGDALFKEMWEAHQTSAFLCAFFIKIYLLLFKTTTGIVLYLQFAGVLFDAFVSYLLYRVVNKYINAKNVAFAMAWVFYIVSPKDMPIPEFANMQVWFSMLLCIMLFLHHMTDQKRFLVLAALSLCGAVLSYPSCAILLVGIGCLFAYESKIKDFLIFTAVCAVTGIVYLSYILTNIPLDELLVSLENMLAIEPTHTIGFGEKFGAYIVDAVKIAAVLLVLYMISYLIAKAICKLKIRDKEYGKFLTDSVFYMLSLTLSLYMVIFWQDFIRYCYAFVFLAVIIIGLHNAKKLTKDKRYLYICGTMISGFNFLATIILTDLELMSSVPYLLISVIVAFLPIAEACRSINTTDLFRKMIKVVVVCGVMFLTFRNAYIIRPINGHVETIASVSGIVKDGPAVGIMSEYMGAYMQNESIKEWDQYIQEGSNIYLIGSSIDTLGYLYEDTDIAAPSVMCTPGYGESISEYWEMNPDKYPDVVIATCWFGELDPELEDNEWIMEWLEEEYEPEHQIDGKYWRYYFRKKHHIKQDHNY